MGRSAIDEEAIRLIEEHNPDVQFDWPRMLKQAPEIKSPEPEPVAQPRERGGDRSADRRGRASRRGAAPPPPVQPREQPPAAERDDAFAVDEMAHSTEAVEERPEAAAFQRLGAEALARLRARYAEVLARIAEREMDDEGRDELKGRAERLNPDGWVTDADVDEGLEQYEAVYESIRAVVGHARKRRG